MIKGLHDHTNVIWNIPIAPTSETLSTTSPQQHALGFIHYSKTIQDLTGYFHASMFSPTPATFL